MFLVYVALSKTFSSTIWCWQLFFLFRTYVLYKKWRKKGFVGFQLIFIIPSLHKPKNFCSLCEYWAHVVLVQFNLNYRFQLMNIFEHTSICWTHNTINWIRKRQKLSNLYTVLSDDSEFVKFYQNPTCNQIDLT